MAINSNAQFYGNCCTFCAKHTTGRHTKDMWQHGHFLALDLKSMKGYLCHTGSRGNSALSTTWSSKQSNTTSTLQQSSAWAGWTWPIKLWGHIPDNWWKPWYSRPTGYRLVMGWLYTNRIQTHEFSLWVCNTTFSVTNVLYFLHDLMPTNVTFLKLFSFNTLCSMSKYLHRYTEQHD